jgi:general nucleoside transport system ATP-binding protein
MNATPAEIEFLSVTKKFGQFFANQDVTFEVAKGSIHAIVGENGAGKTTAMAALFGLHQITQGEIKLRGAPFSPSTPLDAVLAGIGMVHQHFMLNEEETVLDNLILSCQGFGLKLERSDKTGFQFLKSSSTRSQFFTRLKSSFVPLERPTYQQYFESVAESLGYQGLNFSKAVKQLPLGERQKVEILKAISLKSSILILDEPTAVLSISESELLYERLKILAAAGKTIIVVTHKLKDVCKHASNVTVLRKGRSIGTYRVSEISSEFLAQQMISRESESPPFDDLNMQHPKEQTSIACKVSIGGPVELSAPLLRLTNLTVIENGEKKPKVDKVSLDILPGQIVGIAGVEGNGQSELILALSNPSKLKLKGLNVTYSELTSLKRNQIGLIPEDRHKEAICGSLSATQNMLLGNDTHPTLCHRGWLRFDNILGATRETMKEFDVRPSDPSQHLESFSGGNQQKFVLGRELYKKPRLVVAMYPTRGIDFMATKAIHSKLVGMRNRNGGVLVVSSDIDELFELSDVLYVMFSGSLIGPFHRPFREDLIAQSMGGAKL